MVTYREQIILTCVNVQGHFVPFEHWPLAILVNSVKLIDTGVFINYSRGLTPKFQDDGGNNVWN